MGKHFERYWWFLAGIGIYALMARFVVIWRAEWMLEMLRQSVRFIVALFLGRRVSEFVVADDESGHVKFTGKNNVLILLAPYFIGTLLFIGFTVGVVSGKDVVPIFSSMVHGINRLFSGLSLSCRLCSSKSE